MPRWPGVKARRDAAYFLLGPALLVVAIAAAYRLHPWPVPIAAQSQIFQMAPVAILLGLGLVGVTTSSASGLPTVPAIGEKRWKDILLWSLAPGVGFGLLMFVVDAMWGLTANAARSLGATWINVPLPASLGHYTAGAVLVECLYRLIPIPILMWLVGRVALRGRWGSQVFWTLALLSSLLEPASQAGLVQGGQTAPILVFMALTFAANLFEAAHLRTHGWAAPISFRLAFYAVWHCFGPYLLSPHSMLYPGSH